MPSTPSMPHDNHPPSPIPIMQDDNSDDDDDASTTSMSTSSASIFQSSTTTLAQNPDAAAVDHYGITTQDIEQIYCSPHRFGHSFEETFGCMGLVTSVHPTAGLVLSEADGCWVYIEARRRLGLHL